MLRNNKQLSISQIHHWDYEVLRDVCNDRDVGLIKRIPISSVVSEDSWFWIRDEKGEFTVKSCYRWLHGEVVDVNRHFWKRLWSLKIPGKVGYFLWRVCRGYLSTAGALAMKHVDIDISCPWCHQEVETDSHVLFHCDFARTVWQCSEVKSMLHLVPGNTVFDVLIRCFSVFTRDQCVIIGMILWSLWNRRNKWVWDKVNGSVFGVLAAAHNLLYDWKEAQSLALVCGNKEMNMVERKWTKPPEGYVKINCDASGVVNGSVGVGCVVRDSQGRFVGARYCRIEGGWQPREAEVLSLKEGLSWVKSIGYKQCIFETDSQVLAMACKGN